CRGCHSLELRFTGRRQSGGKRHSICTRRAARAGGEKMKGDARRAALLSTLPMPARDHIQGSVDAPTTLLEYGDYECAYCGEAYAVVKEIHQRLGSRLCFAYRNFPLSNVHPRAEHAAEAAESAGEQQRFWEMHDLLYENQDALEDDDLAQYASALGLDAR